MEQDLLHEILKDTSYNGKFVKFYEILQDELDEYTDEKIKDMTGTLIYVYPEKLNEIKNYDKLRILYEYSKLL